MIGTYSSVGKICRTEGIAAFFRRDCTGPAVINDIPVITRRVCFDRTGVIAEIQSDAAQSLICRIFDIAGNREGNRDSSVILIELVGVDCCIGAIGRLKGIALL